jgi:bifunctional ADP-heptose synthase (sugar kinase/adenylyltransferase)
MSKVLSLQQATAKSEILQKEGKRVVLTGGCFDILHLGHI